MPRKKQRVLAREHHIGMAVAVAAVVVVYAYDYSSSHSAARNGDDTEIASALV
jgi:hypothetical protein